MKDLSLCSLSCILALVIVRANTNTTAVIINEENEIFDDKSSTMDEVRNRHIENGTHSYQFIEFDWNHVSTPYIAAFWVLLASTAKIGKYFSNSQ